MVYIHIPFCKSFCTYCDFYSEICSGSGSKEVQNLFCASICKEIESRRLEIEAAASPKTLYFGGGTPSVLPADMIGRIVRTLAGGPYDEFTVEVNPEDIVEKGGAYVRSLLDLGVNRVSMGVQSLDDGILKWMNRRHDSAGAVEAFRILREAGVRNIGMDLIFGLSQLTMDQLDATLDGFIALRPEHVSAYQLSLEDGSALARMVEDGRYREASEELCREQYNRICEVLRDAGYVHYEVSNWALPGHEAVHNSAYWSRTPYAGFGPGAHSFDGKSRRWNSEHPTAWTSLSETLSPEDCRVGTIMLGLRTANGLDAAEARAICSRAALESLLRSGSLVESAGRIRIPEDHFFVSDDIIRQLV
mgnify:CR=1 FL=1